MSVQLWRRVFSYYNLFCDIKINEFRYTSAKLFSKKQYHMKNKFTFHEDFKKNDLKDSKNKATGFLELLSETNDYKESKDSNLTRGFVSADLLSQAESQTSQKIVLPQKTKNRKPSLAYQGEILFGVHPVHLALLQKKRTFYHLYTREDIDSAKDISEKGDIIKLARILNIPISFIDSKGLKILAPGAVHQGVCLDAGFLPLPLWNEDLCDLKTSENRSLWVVLNQILDPMNVGAIIRSAYYFGVNRLFTVIGNSCKLSPTVSKASSGVLELTDIYQIGNLEEFILRRKESGWAVISTVAYSSNESDLIKPINADQFCMSRPTVLILGNEGKGITENILKLCDTLISIKPERVLPQGIDSLNVSVAAGVILYALSNSKSTR